MEHWLQKKRGINIVCLKDNDVCHLLRRTQRIGRPSVSHHKLLLLIHRVLTLQNPHLGLIFLLWGKSVFAIIIWLGPLTLFCALFIKESFLKLHRGFFPPPPFFFSLRSFFVLHKRDSSVKSTFFLLYGSWCSSKNTALKLDPLTGFETTDTQEGKEEG